MSIKKLFKTDRKNKNLEKKGFSKGFTDEEIQSLHELEREMSFAYSFLPPVGFPGCFWHFF